MLPCASAATPSAALVPVAVSSGSGMNAITLPSLTLADANPPLPARVIPRDRARLGVGDVDVVALVDEDPARPAELRPLLDEVAVLIEDLNAVVVAVADEQPPFGIERERVRLIEFARAGAGLAPALDQLAVLRELQDLRLALTVALRDEDLAVRATITSFG